MSISDYWRSHDDASDVNVNKSTATAMRLASTRNAIANFVHIISQRNDIKVTYQTKDESYTDGNSVILSSRPASLNKFDAQAGLALHEGSHVIWSDFSKLKSLMSDVTKWKRSIELFNYSTESPTSQSADHNRGQLDLIYCKIIFTETDAILKHLLEYYINQSPLANWLNFEININDLDSFIMERVQYFKTILNIIEDRRIDAMAMHAAPGYIGYYQAMYDEYFRTRRLNRKLKSGVVNEETWSAYQFHLIHLNNEYFNPSALSKLQDIVDLIDLPTIRRLENTNAAIELTWKVFNIIASVADDIQLQPSNDSNNTNNQDASADHDDRSDKLDQRDIDNVISAINGAIDKGRLNTKIYKQYKALSESNIQTVWTEYMYGNNALTNTNVYVPVHVLNTFTQAQIDSGIYRGLCQTHSRDSLAKSINEGYALGAVLAKKLRTRDEERSLKYTRLSKGVLDKRLIHQLGYQSTNCFQQVVTRKSKMTNIHISIDASASMVSLNRFNMAMKSAIAIARAAEFIETMNVQISLRGTVSGLNPSDTRSEEPMLWIVFDSKKTTVREFAKLAEYLYPNSYTPEGLCINAIHEHVHVNRDEDNYFINISDGQPYMKLSTAQTRPGPIDHDDPAYAILYTREPALRHTKRVVQKLRASGWKIHSLYITRSVVHITDEHAFKYMYGDDAHFIMESELNQLARTLNLMFERNITDFSC